MFFKEYLLLKAGWDKDAEKETELMLVEAASAPAPIVEEHQGRRSQPLFKPRETMQQGGDRVTGCSPYDGSPATLVVRTIG